MALVDYPSSSDDEEEETKEPSAQPTIPSTCLKRKRAISTELPPLPSKFHDLYASTTRLSTRDDPSLHGGRKRVTPHIDGNWPTHIYIEWYPSTAESSLLTALISKLQASARSDSEFEIHSSLTSELGVPLPLHVSLSRTLGFSAEEKGKFVDSLEQAIKASGVRPFDVQFAALDWVANFEETRWFLILRVQRPPGDGLNRLLGVCNKVVEARDQPPLYQSARRAGDKFASIHSPQNSLKKSLRTENSASTVSDASDAFHFSIAWILEQPNPELLQHTRALQTEQLDDIKTIKVQVNEIKAKIGNAVTNMILPSDLLMRKGLFGI